MLYTHIYVRNDMNSREGITGGTEHNADVIV